MKRIQLFDIAFIKYHKVLSLLFNPSEVIFLLHMTDVESLKQMGHKVEWTRSFYIARMGMTTYTFDKCIDTLIDMELISKTNNSDRNKVYYHLNMENYTRLLQILSSNKNIYLIIDFCNKNFKKQKRKIADISDEEILEISRKIGYDK